ncbi:ribonuclease H-like domain-containing protein [Candidatus Nomurabacteria bacterium]|nr:ribonuclease H-like domain-containing protein [Candidatus Kaiserbacteria bacterium]MCB9810267.1 ribonuclease H-like domain-containing protein [Candidatus Nomurabacteria bacterium]
MATLILDIETVGFDSDNKDSLSPYKGQIISLGVYDLERDLGSVYFVGNSADESFEDDNFSYKSRSEKELLEDFWETVSRYDVLVSFNGRAFDVPFLYIRSIALDVKPTVEIAKNRYVTKQSAPYHVDLFDEFSFYGNVTKKPSLAVLCEALGVDNPKLHMKGEDITDFFLEKQFIEIAKYNAKDIVAITKLYKKWLKNLAPSAFLNAVEL